MTAVTAALLPGLAGARLLYEGLFPHAPWLALPWPALLLSGLTAGLGALLWRQLARDGAWRAATVFLPLFLLLLPVLGQTGTVLGSRVLTGASLWLTLAAALWLYGPREVWRWAGPLMLLALLAPVYWLTLGRTVGLADTFEFQVVVPRLGIVHPTGYPLYLLLAKAFTLLPLGEVALEVNLITALFGLLTVVVLFRLILLVTDPPLPALAAALLAGLMPTFWSQAVAAEVYTLHTLLAATALLLLARLLDDQAGDTRLTAPGAAVLLALVLGLGLTNHLTTVILLPVAAAGLILARRAGRFTKRTRPRWLRGWRFPVALGVGLALPLLLYLYLPLRWQAVNGETMGLARFVDWVIGGRFQGALQLEAWLADPTRYQIVGRLLLAEWQPVWTMLPALIGAVWLHFRRPGLGLLLLLTWLGFLFYALNYFVPDLAVFILPAHLVMAVWWAVGLGALADGLRRLRPTATAQAPLATVLLLLLLGPLLLTVVRETWPAVDASGPNPRVRWAGAVLDLPLAPDAAILADSDKFPALFYLQQAEGRRTDLDIVLLPDEAAYRADLEARLAAGQVVYLARFLPGLAGRYHLRSAGPLTEVATAPLAEPAFRRQTPLAVGPAQLLGFSLAARSPYAADDSAVIFYWQTERALDQVLHVYTRWSGVEGQPPPQGQHPVNNNYPTVAWRPGEVVADYHTVPRPAMVDAQPLALQVALAPPFSDPAGLNWQTVTETIVPPRTMPAGARQLRQQIGPTRLSAVAVSARIRPASNARVLVQGYGPPAALRFDLQPAEAPLAAATTAIISEAGQLAPFVIPAQIDTDRAAGRYALVASALGPARCGWLARPTAGCRLAELLISGEPLPPGAVNLDDKVALLDVDVGARELQPGAQLHVDLTWQALAPMAENYTVFVQVLDEADRIVGQVDSWPVQGTYPTSQWSAGEVVRDPYRVTLDEALPPGRYRLHVGMYLLETLRRLPIVNEAGAPVDDKVEVQGLVVR